eukprot:Gb_22158 [translate_table: standard]
MEPVTWSMPKDGYALEEKTTNHSSMSGSHQLTRENGRWMSKGTMGRKNFCDVWDEYSNIPLATLPESATKRSSKVPAQSALVRSVRPAVLNAGQWVINAVKQPAVRSAALMVVKDRAFSESNSSLDLALTKFDSPLTRVDWAVTNTMKVHLQVPNYNFGMRVATTSGTALPTSEDTLKTLKEKHQEKEQEPESGGGGVFLCSYEGCGKTFTEAGALRKHSHVHGERQHVCHYEGCGRPNTSGQKRVSEDD